MNLKEALEQLPEAERANIVAEVQKAASADDIAAIAKRYDLEVDAQATFDKFNKTEVDEEDLKKIAGGCNCGCYIPIDNPDNN